MAGTSGVAAPGRARSCGLSPSGAIADTVARLEKKAPSSATALIAGLPQAGASANVQTLTRAAAAELLVPVATQATAVTPARVYSSGGQTLKLSNPNCTSPTEVDPAMNPIAPDESEAFVSVHTLKPFI
jgi:hypothetical protein